jgi:hypothetical protein
MRLQIVLFLLLAGCNRTAERMVGEWRFDPATYELIPRYRELSPEEQRHWIETARFDLTITEDRLAWDQELPGWGRREVEGRYEIEDVDGGRVTLTALFEGKPERMVFTVQENRLRFGLKGRSIILRRSR